MQQNDDEQNEIWKSLDNPAILFLWIFIYF